MLGAILGLQKTRARVVFMDSGDELERVRGLSDGDLLSGLSHVLRVSRRTAAEVVAHLGEVESRRLHLLGGYASMFAYCVSRLGMSEDEAYRRIEVARLVRRFPLLFNQLANGHVSLTVAALLKSHLTSANHEALLAAVSSKTVQQAREVLACWFPRPDVMPLIRKLPTREEHGAVSSVEVAPAGERPDSGGVPLGSPGAVEPVVGTPHAAASVCTEPGPCVAVPPRLAASRRLEPLSPGRYELQLTAGAELKRKLELARDLLRHAVPSGDLAEILERALDLLLERTMKRRFALTAPSKADAPSTRPTSTVEADAVAPPPKGTEPAAARPSTRTHLPNEVRRTVFTRDQGRCTWEGPDGTRCNSRAWLEHDHVTPRGQGGSNAAANIRIRCRPHNRLAAEQAYGRDTIDRAIARQRRARCRYREPP